jgi:hypothetical protein
MGAHSGRNCSLHGSQEAKRNIERRKGRVPILPIRAHPQSLPPIMLHFLKAPQLSAWAENEACTSTIFTLLSPFHSPSLSHSYLPQ